jgi:hypothetical protein
MDLMNDIEVDRIMMAYAITMRSDQIPLVVFSYLRNNVQTCYEILNNYANHWLTIPPELFLQEIDTEIKPRLIEIQKMFFVYIISAVEYVTVEYHNQHPIKLGTINKRQIYLWDIMNKSKDIGIISTADFECWEGLIELRNRIVHSNTIGNKNMLYLFPGLMLEFRKNQPIQGSPLAFPILTNWLRVAIKDWILKIDAV